ncbi:hypothetical protein [Psychroserpens luteus]|jgi:hypothetical protein|uniref:Lipoprotein n=1 Tax=Psychroserpens luteus TaxID=1434066 RepID=A0ABW5ZUX5_9FLAO|nr:hypothetical protein [Psychroserpens luteus]
MNKKYIITILILGLIGFSITFLFNNKDSKSICPKKTEFNSNEWKSNIDSRFCMMTNIIETELLINKTKVDLEKILGKPFLINDFYNGKSHLYKTNVKANEYLNWYLFVQLKNDSVVSVQKASE